MTLCAKCSPKGLDENDNFYCDKCSARYIWVTLDLFISIYLSIFMQDKNFSIDTYTKYIYKTAILVCPI